MSFFGLIIKRHSVRAYLQKPVEEEKLIKIMGAGLHSASARNRQPYKVYVVQDKELRDKIVRANSSVNFWIREAPVIMVITINRRLLPGQGDFKHNYLDAGIMIGNLMLAASEQSLGSCPCAAFDKSEVEQILIIPKSLKAIICLPIGYPREERKGMLDVEKDYEKVVSKLLHYKERKIEDIFIRK